MPIKSIKAAAPVAPKTTKTTQPVVTLEGNLVSRYNQAKIDLKNAEAVMEEIEPELKAEGGREYFALAIANPTNAPTSIKLVDSEDAVVLLSFKNAYNQSDLEAVDAAFHELGADAGDYARESLKLSFDSKVFINKQGEFNERMYAEMKKAIDAVATKFGVESPLSGKKIVGPKEDFHAKRFTEFPTVEAQVTIQAAMPAQFALKAVAATE